MDDGGDSVLDVDVCVANVVFFLLVAQLDLPEISHLSKFLLR